MDAGRAEIESLETRMAAPGFWDRPEEAQRIVARLKRVKRAVEDWSRRSEALGSLDEMLQLAESESDERLLADLSGELDTLEKEVGELELRSLLSGEYDRLGSLISMCTSSGSIRLLAALDRYRCSSLGPVRPGSIVIEAR